MGVAVTIELEPLTCCECGMSFAVPGLFERERRRDHKWFYCPAGHSQHFPAEDAETKLRRERDRLKQQLAQKDDEINEARAGWREADDRAKAERHRANGYKGHATKIAKRAKAGMCPCCRRTFAALAEHMRTQHPTFTPLEVIEGGKDASA